MNDILRVHSPEGVELEFRLAGVASRSAAFLIDFLLQMGCLALVVLLFTFSGAHFTGTEEEASWAMALLVMVSFLVNWGYSTWFEASWGGRTPGKKWMGLRTLRQDGSPINLQQALLRNFCRAVDGIPGVYTVAMICIAVDPQSRRVGDIVAGTVVVHDRFRKEMSRSLAGAAWAERAEKGQARRALALPGGSLSAQQLSIIEQFRERKMSLPEARREELASRMAAGLRPLLGEELLLLLDGKAADRAQQTLERIWALSQSAASAPVTSSGKAKGGLF